MKKIFNVQSNHFGITRMHENLLGFIVAANILGRTTYTHNARSISTALTTSGSYHFASLERVAI